MAVVQAPTLEDYTRHLESHSDEAGALVKALLIKVTEFFRDPDAFQYLRTSVLPEIIARARNEDRAAAGVVGRLRDRRGGVLAGHDRGRPRGPRDRRMGHPGVRHRSERGGGGLCPSRGLPGGHAGQRPRRVPRPVLRGRRRGELPRVQEPAADGDLRPAGPEPRRPVPAHRPRGVPQPAHLLPARAAGGAARSSSRTRCTRRAGSCSWARRRRRVPRTRPSSSSTRSGRSIAASAARSPRPSAGPPCPSDVMPGGAGRGGGGRRLRARRGRSPAAAALRRGDPALDAGGRGGHRPPVSNGHPERGRAPAAGHS